MKSEIQRVLIVSYTFGATHEIGARRMNALAAFLAARGHSVDVIYWQDPAFAEDLSSSLFREWPELRLNAVRNSPSRTIRWLIAAKKELLRIAGKDRNNGSKPTELHCAPDTSNPNTAATGVFGALWRVVHRAFMSTVFSIDGKKGWTIRAARLGLRLNREKRYSCVIASGPPVVACLVATWLSKRLNIPAALDLRDPWNSNAMIPAPLAIVRRLDIFLERWCLQHASLITLAAPGIKRRALPRHADLLFMMHVVLNGYEDCDRIADAMPTGTLNMLYAGTLYMQRNPFPLLAALARLARAPGVDRQKLRFTLIGECESWGGVRLVDWCREHQVEDLVSILPPIPRQELASLRRAANVLVNFSQGQPEQIPAKTFEMLASGRYIMTLAEADSDTARILAAAGIPGVVDDRSPATIDSALAEFYARLVRGESAVKSLEPDIVQFSRANQNEAWYTLLQGMRP